MRRGEVYGLHRDDLDFDAGRVRVRRQLIDRVGLVEHTKSDHGQRIIDLDPETVAVLRRHLAAQAAVRLAVGPGYADQGLVFAAGDGGPLNPAKEAEKFGRRIARAGVPRIRWHDLRHSHASHLLKAGVNIKVVSRRFGPRLGVVHPRPLRPPHARRRRRRCPVGGRPGRRGFRSSVTVS